MRQHFTRYVGWLTRQGYDFGSCENFAARLDRRCVYLRYDVHVRDLFGAFALAALHEEMQIPGSFQICWEHSRAEVAVWITRQSLAADQASADAVSPPTAGGLGSSR